MNCQQTQELMSAHLDAELDVADEASLQSHLAGCAGCRAALAELEALQGRVSAQATAYQAPSHLWHRIQAALESIPLAA